MVFINETDWHVFFTRKQIAIFFREENRLALTGT